MIVLVVYVRDVGPVEAKCHPPVAAHIHRPCAVADALERKLRRSGSTDRSVGMDAGTGRRSSLALARREEGFPTTSLDVSEARSTREASLAKT